MQVCDAAQRGLPVSAPSPSLGGTRTRALDGRVIAGAAAAWGADPVRWDCRRAEREIGVYWYLFSNLVVWCRDTTEVSVRPGVTRTSRGDTTQMSYVNFE